MGLTAICGGACFPLRQPQKALVPQVVFAHHPEDPCGRRDCTQDTSGALCEYDAPACGYEYAFAICHSTCRTDDRLLSHSAVAAADRAIDYAWRVAAPESGSIRLLPGEGHSADPRRRRSKPAGILLRKDRQPTDRRG